MTRTRRLVLPLLSLIALVSPLSAELGWNGASSIIVLEKAARAKTLDDPAPVYAVGVLEDALEGQCLLLAQNEKVPRKGVKGTVTASLIDANTFSVIETLPRQTARTGKDGSATYSYNLPRRGGFAQQVALVAEVDLKGGKKVIWVSFSCELADATPGSGGGILVPEFR